MCSPGPITIPAHCWCPQGSLQNSPPTPCPCPGVTPHSWACPGSAPRETEPTNHSQAGVPLPQAAWQGSRPPLGRAVARTVGGVPGRRSLQGPSRSTPVQTALAERNREKPGQAGRCLPPDEPSRHSPVLVTEGRPCGRNHQEWGGRAHAVSPYPHSLPPGTATAGTAPGPSFRRRPTSLGAAAGANARRRWVSLPQVDDLKATLAIQEAELKQKNENADKLIHVVGVETEKVSKEKAIADEEEAKVEVINKVRRQARLPASARLCRPGLPHWAPGTASGPGAVGSRPAAGRGGI